MTHLVRLYVHSPLWEKKNVMFGMLTGMVRLLHGLTDKSPFAKIVIAFFQALGCVEGKDPELIRQYLSETADVKNPFLVRLRNQAIVAAKLEQEVSLIEPEPALDEYNPE